MLIDYTGQTGMAQKVSLLLGLNWEAHPSGLVGLPVTCVGPLGHGPLKSLAQFARLLEITDHDKERCLMSNIANLNNLNDYCYSLMHI